jgi:isoleucyl-tRNA synthetase
MNGAMLVVASGLIDTLQQKLLVVNNDKDSAAGGELPSSPSTSSSSCFTVHGTLKGDALTGTLYQHPLYDRTSAVVVGGDYITTESGTGLVHTAPGHGQEDYLTGLKYNLPLLSPVNDMGCFTEEAGAR